MLYDANGQNPRAPDSFIGEKVRISSIKGVFEKVFILNWTVEQFCRKGRLAKLNPEFSLEDDISQPIKGMVKMKNCNPLKKTVI